MGDGKKILSGGVLMGLHPVEKDFDFSERTFDKQNV